METKWPVQCQFRDSMQVLITGTLTDKRTKETLTKEEGLLQDDYAVIFFWAMFGNRLSERRREAKTYTNGVAKEAGLGLRIMGNGLPCSP